MEKFKQFNIKFKWTHIVALSVFIGILGGTAEFSGYSLKDLWNSDAEEIDYFDITVFIHGKKGKHNHILENKGKVVMLLNTDKRDEKIGDKGEVNFKELPKSFENKNVTFYLIDTENEPYQVVQPDSQYVLIPNRAIHLEVFLANLDHIKGTVRDREDTSKRLSNVSVCIDNICVKTDKDGHYLLELPERIQRKFQTISFRKNGYEEYIKHQVPMQVDSDFDVVLKLKK